MYKRHFLFAKHTAMSHLKPWCKTRGGVFDSPVNPWHLVVTKGTISNVPLSLNLA